MSSMEHGVVPPQHKQGLAAHNIASVSEIIPILCYSAVRGKDGEIVVHFLLEGDPVEKIHALRTAFMFPRYALVTQLRGELATPISNSEGFIDDSSGVRIYV